MHRALINLTDKFSKIIPTNVSSKSLRRDDNKICTYLEFKKSTPSKNQMGKENGF